MQFSIKSIILISSLVLSSTLFAKGKTVAEVNGVKITKDYFDKIYYQNKLFVGSEKITKEKILNRLINRELGIQRAKSKKLSKDPIVKEKVEDVLYHAMVSKDLENELAKIKVSDDEVKNYYTKNPEYRTAHILFRTRAKPTKEELSGAMTTALKVKAELDKDPAKFPELANKYSQSAAAQVGGDIGYQPAFKLAFEYYQAIKGKKPGHITQIVKTGFGIHIIKVISKKDYGKIQKEIYKKHIYDTKRDAILSQYFKRIRAKAKIKVNKELLK